MTALLAEVNRASEGRKMTEEEADEIIRKIDPTKIMYPHKEKDSKPWGGLER